MADKDPETSIDVVGPRMPGVTRSKWTTLARGNKFALSFRHGHEDDAFFISRGVRKSIAEFPLTPEGWRQAWREFASLEREAADEYHTRMSSLAARTRFAAALPRGLAHLSQCTYLGGYGTALSPGTACEIVCDDTAFDIYVRRQSVHRVDYDQVHEIEITGRGLLKSGGGFIGGGFGALGVVEGMAIAGVLNSLAARTAMETVLRLNCAGQELFFHSASLTPANLRIQLSSVIALTAAGQSKVAASTPVGPTDDLIDRIERLASLFREGLLSSDEFEAGKKAILGGGST